MANYQTTAYSAFGIPVARGSHEKLARAAQDVVTFLMTEYTADWAEVRDCEGRLMWKKAKNEITERVKTYEIDSSDEEAQGSEC